MFAGSFPKWPQWWELGLSEARSFIQVAHGCRVPRTGPSSGAFPSHKHGAGLKVEHQGRKLVPIVYAGTMAPAPRLRTFTSILKSH